MRTELQKMLERVLDGATTSLEELAAEAGISYDTLYAWRSGRRNPTRGSLARLADALDRQAGALQGLAREVRAVAGRGGEG